MMLLSLVAAFVFIVSNADAQNCILPDQTEIEGQISELLQNSDASNTDPVTVSSFQYTCQVQGDRRDTYRQLSIIASYTNAVVGAQTRQFQLLCLGNQWDPSTTDGLDPPPNNYQSLSTRTDCRQCAEGFGDHNCRTCSPACPGSGRCPGNNQCCSYFATDGTCTNNCTESDGINYISGTASTNFTCTCNLMCNPGYIANATCNECILNDICMADNPCQNGGTCTLLSSPNNYTCNCTDTEYDGMNCTVCTLNCPAGYIADNVCSMCILDDICTADNPCQNGGVCTLLSSPDSYTCNCTGTKYDGINCTVCTLNCPAGYAADNVCTQCILDDICLANSPCKNGGTCTLLSSPDSYNCNCTGYFDGLNCTACSLICNNGFTANGDCTQCVLKDICIADNPCQNGAICISYSSNNYTCSCNGSFTGINCTDCSLNCQNGGNPDDHCSLCTCPMGYTGSDCTTAINYCVPSPCGIYGLCTKNASNPDGYSCTCREGWKGKTCRDCLIDNCIRCTGVPPKCEQCADEYDIDSAGSGCVTKNICSTLPCKNNGTCFDSIETYRCECIKPWTGSNCTVCGDGFGLRGTQCVSCEKDCLNCAANASVCIECHDSFDLYSGNCIKQLLSISTIIWIIVGCILGALLIIALISAIVMAFVRCAGSYNEKRVSKGLNKDIFRAGNKVSDNPLYVSHEDINKVITEEEEDHIYVN